MASAKTTPQTAPDDSQTTPKAKCPSSPIRIDWASLQSSFSSDDATLQDSERDACRTPPRPITPLPGSVKRKRSTTSDDLNPRQPNHPTMGLFKAHVRVYDVPTLMEYRNSLAGLTVFAKIRPEALNGSLESVLKLDIDADVEHRKSVLSHGCSAIF